MNDKNKDLSELYSKLEFYNKFDAIINVAGGWVGHGLKDKDFLLSIDQMYGMNSYSTFLAAHLATKFLKEKSLLLFTGALAVKENYSWVPEVMLSYQLSKASIFNLTDILSQNRTLLPKDTKLITILPGTIDTEVNRKNMPNADFSTWTKPDDIATNLNKWADNPQLAPNDIYVKV